MALTLAMDAKGSLDVQCVESILIVVDTIELVQLIKTCGINAGSVVLRNASELE